SPSSPQPARVGNAVGTGGRRECSPERDVACCSAMKIELRSLTLCPFVHLSTIMLHVKGATVAVQYIDFPNNPDWFLAISPRGKVPLLLVDGTALFESSAINEFIDETRPPRLLPEDPLERARQRAWVEVANDVFVAQYKLSVAATKG